jgi:Ni/Co efflux regulator RcnB
MRKLLFTILLASAAASPALAAQHNSDRDQAREDRQQVREERQQAREERQQTVRENRVERNQQVVRQQSFDNNRANIQRDRNVARDARAYDRQQRIDNRNVQFQQRVDNRALRYRQPVVTQTAPVTNYSPRTTSRYDRHRWSGQWNTNWRNDHRYDWRNYRNRHRSIFHLGFYYDPFGFGYSPFNIGYQLRPAYYSQNYWFDPSMYGLPYPPPGTQWVRYWNDALLVDVYSGQVVDVIHNFFW